MSVVQVAFVIRYVVKKFEYKDKEVRRDFRCECWHMRSDAPVVPFYVSLLKAWP